MNKWIASLLWVVAVGSARAAIVDGTFNDSDWTTIKLADNTVGSAAAASAGQSPAGGNPGAFRSLTHHWTTLVSGAGISFAHIDVANAFQPLLDGALTSFNLSYQAIVTSAPLVNAIGFTPLLLQSGDYYNLDAAAFQANHGVAFNNAVILGQGWTSKSFTGLIASDFKKFGSVGAPDFSASGGDIFFGYLTSNGGSGAVLTINATGGLDNFNVSAGHALVVIPEPTMLPMLAGLLGLAMRRNRRL